MNSYIQGPFSLPRRFYKYVWLPLNFIVTHFYYWKQNTFRDDMWIYQIIQSSRDQQRAKIMDTKYHQILTNRCDWSIHDIWLTISFLHYFILIIQLPTDKWINLLILLKYRIYRTRTSQVKYFRCINQMKNRK